MFPHRRIQNAADARARGDAQLLGGMAQGERQAENGERAEAEREHRLGIKPSESEHDERSEGAETVRGLLHHCSRGDTRDALTTAFRWTPLA
jgi:hypothetical protein